jgi:hypothetical protein
MWACIAGGLVGTPLFLFLLLVNTLGNYGDGERPSILFNALLPSLGVGFGAGSVVWLLVKLLRRYGS